MNKVASHKPNFACVTFKDHRVVQSVEDYATLEFENRPRVSSTIASFYSAMVIFIAALIVFFAYAGFFTPMGSLGIVAAIGVIPVEAVMIFPLASLYKTRYIIREEELVIKTSKLIGGGKKVPLRAIKSVEKTLIPFGAKLFGASFHGGYYYFPGLGRAFMAITNFGDGVLMRTERGNYIITPKDPEKFIETILVRLSYSSR